MGYKLKTFNIEDIRTGRACLLKAKSRHTLDKRLGKRANDVLIKQVK